MSQLESLPTAASDLAAEPDDRREANAWPTIRVLFAIRNAILLLALVVWLASWLIDFAVVKLNLSPSQIRSWAGYGSAGLVFGLQPLLLAYAERYREETYEPLFSVKNALLRFREAYDGLLAESKFARIGAYVVKGSPFSTQAELFLGCQRMVIAEFLSLGRKKAIELISITESGRVVVTISAAGVPGERLEQFFPHVVCTTHVGTEFKKLLAWHLRRTAEIAEQSDSVIAELGDDDVVDVMRYYNRAYYDARVYSGKAKDPVGPMTYGRFRFPLGMVKSARS